MPSKEALEARVELAEANLRAREVVLGVSHRHPLIAIARVFRVRVDAAFTRATFTPEECVIDDVIREIGTALQATGILVSRHHIEAWYHACGVEVP